MTAGKWVFAGGPGAGKTTLIHALKARGYVATPDSARAIIAERKAAGLSPRPDALTFAREILARDLAAYDAVLGRTALLDRCYLDALGMLEDLGVEVDAPGALARRPVSEPIFLFPAWAAIYVRDAERDHDFDHAERVAEHTRRWYASLGLTVVELPQASVARRLEFVAAYLDGSA